MTVLGYKFSDKAKANMSAGQRGRRHSDETKAKMAAAGRRRYEDPAERAKIGAVHKGVPKSPQTRARMSAATQGEGNSQWRGDAIGYDAAHKRAKRVLPAACAHADKTCKGILEVAFKHDTHTEFVKIDPATGYRYSPRPEDYMRLCASHHRLYDDAQANLGAFAMGPE